MNRREFLKTTSLGAASLAMPASLLVARDSDNEMSAGQILDQADARQTVPDFAAGQLVHHNSFGLGTVKEFIDMGENSVVVVKFNSGQTKSLMLKYADLSKM